jgi:hypothetical protein
MRLVMIMAVRDAADVVRENLDYHLSQGVDLALVTDHRSGDGTTRILREYERRGAVRLLRRRGPWDQAAQYTELAQLAVREHGADWVLPNDADEFWLPREGTVREALLAAPAEAAFLRCRRVNFVATPEDGRVWWQRMTLRQRLSSNDQGSPLPGKVVHRAWPGLEIRKGNHRPAEGAPGKGAALETVEVLHFQMRSYGQFERGVRQLARELRRSKAAGHGPGKARRRQVRMLRAGKLASHYERLTASAPGEAVVEDERLARALSRLYDVPLQESPAGARGGAAFALPPPAPFVVGVPRSGTTLLRLMLDAHPELAIPPETAFLPRVIRRWHELEADGAGDDERLAACLELITSHPRWAALEIERGALQAHLASLRSPTVGDVARSVHVVSAAQRGKPRWGDKTPRYLKHMFRLKQALPEARFVHVIRDGRDIAVSLAQVSWGPDDEVAAARQWSRWIRRARRLAIELPPGAYTEVRYEELVSDPDRALRRVAEAMELPWDAAMLAHHEGGGERLAPVIRDSSDRAGGPITAAERARAHGRAAQAPDPDRIGRWRERMTDGAVERFEGIAGDLLAELGYEVGARP